MLLRPSGVPGSGSRPARACPGAISVSQLPFRQGVRLAVDVGSVRVGVARSDPGGILASPLAVLASGPGAKAAQARAELARLAASEGAIEVIVGLPTSLSGREGTAAPGAREFASDLAGRLAPVPVRLVDERFTTTEAHDALRRGGKDARARRQVVDAAAAAVLLQAALDAERATGRPPGQLVRADDGAGARERRTGGGWPAGVRGHPRHSRGSTDPRVPRAPRVPQDPRVPQEAAGSSRPSRRRRLAPGGAPEAAAARIRAGAPGAEVRRDPAGQAAGPRRPEDWRRPQRPSAPKLCSRTPVRRKPATAPRRFPPAGPVRRPRRARRVQRPR
jgi:putative Holliday junction resolvase